MIVAAQHQVDAVLSRPADVVGRVAQQQTKMVFRALSQIGFPPIPRPFMTDGHELFPADVNGPPAIAQHLNAQPRQSPSNPLRPVPNIVIAEYGESGFVPIELVEKRQQPAMMAIRV